MSDIQAQYIRGVNVYALIRNSSSQIWNGSSFVSYVSANLDTYDVPMAEQGTSGFYEIPFPSGIPESILPYSVTAHHRVGATPNELDPLIATGLIRNTQDADVASFQAPTVVPRPSSGDQDFTIWWRLINARGSVVAPDTGPTFSALDSDGNNVSANIVAGPTSDSYGYAITYRVSSTHNPVPVIISVAYTKDSVSRTDQFQMSIVDFFDYVNDVVSANVTQLGGNASALNDLRDMYDTAIVRDTINDLTPTTTVFKTNLGGGYEDDFFNNAAIVFIDGPQAGQTRRISAYVDSTGAITVATPFTTAPNNGNTFLILGRIE